MHSYFTFYKLKDSISIKNILQLKGMKSLREVSN